MQSLVQWQSLYKQTFIHNIFSILGRGGLGGIEPKENQNFSNPHTPNKSKYFTAIKRLVDNLTNSITHTHTQTVTFKHNVNDGTIFNGVFISERSEYIVSIVFKEKQLLQ